MKNGVYRIKNATRLELYVSVATAYQNEYPGYAGNDYEAVNNRAMTLARNTDYEVMKHEHQKDFGALFGRVEIDLGAYRTGEADDGQTAVAVRTGGIRPWAGGIVFSVWTLFAD